MPDHHPIHPARAIELVEAKNLADAQSLLADFAAAGLIKTYALMREIRPVGKPSKALRDSQIPTEEWERIVASGSINVALNGGTVRLEGSPLQDGTPFIQITGISFSEASLVKVLDRYCAAAPASPAQTAAKARPKTEAQANPSVSQDSVMKNKHVPPIKQGDLTASVAQTMQTTGLGRTKIDQLMKEGTLVRRKIGNRSLITVESIERLVGASVCG